MIDNLALGFSVALTLNTLAFAFLGALIGTAIGVLPGLGPTATISLLLPITFGVEPTTAILMLAGIYYGSQYGGSTTAILPSLPGEISAVATATEGHKMAQRIPLPTLGIPSNSVMALMVGALIIQPGPRSGCSRCRCPTSSSTRRFLVFCCSSAYSINSNALDIYVMLGFVRGR